MRIYLCFSIIIILLTGCEKSLDFITNSNGNRNENTAHSDDFIYFYLSDSLGNVKTHFDLNQDILFHFSLINTKDSTITYTKSHGGTPVVSFWVYKNDTLFGQSDDGYDYDAIVLPGYIEPGDTLINIVSWKSNPYHQNTLARGQYYTKIFPYIWFYDFNLSSFLDTIYFEIN